MEHFLKKVLMRLGVEGKKPTTKSFRFKRTPKKNHESNYVTYLPVS